MFYSLRTVAKKNPPSEASKRTSYPETRSDTYTETKRPKPGMAITTNPKEDYTRGTIP